MTRRESLILYGPAALLAVGSAFAAKAAWWAPIVFAVVVFVLFAGTGLVLGARAARP
jgi:CHASE2 domain-containing sensor protein